MRKRKLAQSVLAVGMALTLASAPLVSGAETEQSQTAEVPVENQVGAVPSSALDSFLDVRFGDALYKIYEGQGTDMSWLKECSFYGKLVPAEETLEAEGIIGLNDETLFHVLASLDPASGTLFLSIPEFFDQTVSFNLQELMENVSTGAIAGEQDTMSGALTQMISAAVSQIYGDVQELVASLPVEVWQAELSSYLMPVMSNLVQETGEDVLTVGGKSADVATVTYSIPPEKMGDVISGLITAMEEDPVVGIVLESDAVSNGLGLLSLVTGGTIQLTGDGLLEQYQGLVESLRSFDVSNIPGISFTLQSSEDGNAVGMQAALRADGNQMDLCSFKAIADGEEHVYEAVPGAFLLNMAGMDPGMTVSIEGQGSSADRKINEEANLLVNGESAAKAVVKDYDIARLMEDGSMIGTFRFETGDVSAQVAYNVLENNARTIEYLYNDEVFYQAEFWAGEAEDDSITPIDKDNVLEIGSIDDLKSWIGSFRMDVLMDALVKAGAPVNGAVAAETEADPAA